MCLRLANIDITLIANNSRPLISQLSSRCRSDFKRATKECLKEFFARTSIFYFHLKALVKQPFSPILTSSVIKISVRENIAY
jgi:hypothetical protein